jgi:hypothetical protein
MAEFGAAVHDAQVLEKSLELILAILSSDETLRSSLPALGAIYAPDTHKTLGQLIKALRKVVDLPKQADDQLELVLKTRNSLVHGHFKNEGRLRATLTTAGVQTLLSELHGIRGALKSAKHLTDGILDRLLEKYGMSVEAARAEAQRKFVEANLEEFCGSLQ